MTSASVVTVDGEDKGRVRAVADMIQEITGGGLFSIQTSVQYPADGGNFPIENGLTGYDDIGRKAPALLLWGRAVSFPGAQYPPR